MTLQLEPCLPPCLSLHKVWYLVQTLDLTAFVPVEAHHHGILLGILLHLIERSEIHACRCSWPATRFSVWTCSRSEIAVVSSLRLGGEKVMQTKVTYRYACLVHKQLHLWSWQLIGRGKAQVGAHHGGLGSPRGDPTPLDFAPLSCTVTVYSLHDLHPSQIPIYHFMLQLCMHASCHQQMVET